VSAQSLAADAASLIEKETNERRTSNIQLRTSNNDGAALYLILKYTNHANDLICLSKQPGQTSAEGSIRSAWYLFKSTEYRIRCWTFNLLTDPTT
jgi:hypothetical protein